MIMLEYNELNQTTLIVNEIYHYYGIPLWLLYVRLVYSVIKVFSHNGHFPALVGANGVMDITLYLLGNFFYRWPHSESSHQSLYQYLEQNNYLLAFLNFLMSVFFYALFISTLFMAFYMFSVICLYKHWHLWWNECLYRYFTVILVLPLFCHLNLFLSIGRFRQEGEEYYFTVTSLIPQVITRNVSLVILQSLLFLTMFLLLISVVRLTSLPFLQPDRVLLNHEWSNTFIVFVYTINRAIFVFYQFTASYLTSIDAKTELYILGRSFPFWNDIMTLSPGIILIIISQPVRRLTFPFLYWKKVKPFKDTARISAKCKKPVAISPKLSMIAEALNEKDFEELRKASVSATLQAVQVKILTEDMEIHSHRDIGHTDDDKGNKEVAKEESKHNDRDDNNNNNSILENTQRVADSIDENKDHSIDEPGEFDEWAERKVDGDKLPEEITVEKIPETLSDSHFNDNLSQRTEDKR